jgi:phosphinothricin acetyltransferase
VPEPEAPQIRAARRADAEAICAIYNAAIAERVATFETSPSSPEDLDWAIGEERFALLVAELDGKVLGWAGLSPYSRRAWYSGVAEASVYVDAAARRAGVGAALTDALAKAAAAGGFHKLIAKLFTGNAASIRLFERCGFESVGIHRRHGTLDGRWLDVLLMERSLG